MTDLRGVTVLICDDEAAAIMCRLVRAYGGQCEAYTTFTEARERLYEDPEFFDVAIIDLRLLNGNGADLIRELRVARPELPTVLMSAAEPQEVLAENLGCAFLPKPLDGEDLCRAILGALETERPKPW